MLRAKIPEKRYAVLRCVVLSLNTKIEIVINKNVSAANKENIYPTSKLPKGRWGGILSLIQLTVICFQFYLLLLDPVL